MRLDWLDIENFKKFTRQRFELHPQFTLLVGDNGSGKTSVLDALAVALGLWHKAAPGSGWRNILTEEVRHEPVVLGDRVSFEPRLPATITVGGSLGAVAGLTWTRMIKPGGTRTTNASARKAETAIQALVKQAKAGEAPLPVLAYYGAGRAWLPTNKRPRERVSLQKPTRFDAYHHCLDTRIRDQSLNEWFLFEVAAANGHGGETQALRAVKHAMLGAIPEADALWFDGQRRELAISIGGVKQTFYDLSAGQRMMVALVADLAIKAVTLNPQLLPGSGPASGDPAAITRESPGVVLIDELDVHLHPTWQRRVAADLKRTFPQIQFVCTSHSPQVIGELSRAEVRLLRPEGVAQPEVARGADSNWILDHVMQAASETSDVRRLKEAVETALEAGDLENAASRLKALRSFLEGETGELCRLEHSLYALEVLDRDDGDDDDVGDVT